MMKVNHRMEHACSNALRSRPVSSHAGVERQLSGSKISEVTIRHVAVTLRSHRQPPASKRPNAAIVPSVVFV